MSSAQRAKVDRPETLRQARRWESLAVTYRAAGLCDRCASQAATARQLGHSQSAGPCSTCWPLWARMLPVSGSALTETPDNARAVSESAARPRRRDAGPHPWELCYLPGGIREGRYAEDRAEHLGWEVAA